MRSILYAAFALFLLSCNTAHNRENKPVESPGAPPAAPAVSSKLPLDKIVLPPGFKIATYAEGVVNARSMCLSPQGTLFVSTREEGSVYALRDTNGDFQVDQIFTLAKKLSMPNGVALRNGALYVAEVNRILRYDNIEKCIDALAKGSTDCLQPVTVYDQYPTDTHHGWKYIAFGPDGKLYIPVGAPCNICEPEKPIYASMTRLDVDKPGAQPEIIAHGIRNSVGFDWHPVTKELWFTDNGRDMLGDDIPPCELNHLTQVGQHFGYPYCHGGTISDPEFGKKRPCSDFVAPAQNLGPHVAPLGMQFYTGKMFPETYRNQIFIAEHGSWNRSKKIGYRLSLVRLDAQGKSLGYTPFAEGWLQDQSAWGRPVDLEMLPDGSLLISDDQADAIYRVWYAG
ncbi:MAG: sorbosone dehydrogenase family protein [Saprospiraceae bacterium]